MDEKRFLELFPEPEENKKEESKAFFRHIKQQIKPEQCWQPKQKKAVLSIKKYRKRKMTVIYGATAAACLVLAVVLPNLPKFLEMSGAGTEDTVNNSLHEAAEGEFDEGGQETVQTEEPAPQADSTDSADFVDSSDSSDSSDGGSDDNSAENRNTSSGSDDNANHSQASQSDQKEEKNDTKQPAAEENADSPAKKQNTGEKTKDSKDKKNMDDTEKTNNKKDTNDIEDIKKAVPVEDTESDDDTQKNRKQQDLVLKAALIQWFLDEMLSTEQSSESANDSISQEESLDSTAAGNTTATADEAPETEMSAAEVTETTADEAPETEMSAAEVTETTADTTAEMETVVSDDSTETKEISWENILEGITLEDIQTKLEQYAYLYDPDEQGKDCWYQACHEVTADKGNKILKGSVLLFQKPSHVLDEENPQQYQAYAYEDVEDPSKLYVRYSVNGESRYYCYKKM